MSGPRFLKLYTDGSCPVNPDGPGGYAAIAVEVDGAGAPLSSRVVAQGGEPKTTNNRMELRAVIEGLSALNSEGATVVIYSDSEYVVKGYSEWMPRWLARGWKTGAGKPVLNVDLWKALLEVTKSHHRVVFRHVKGHNGDFYNEEADRLAGEQTARMKERIALGEVVIPADAGSSQLGLFA